jgi:hypothetical protein
VRGGRRARAAGTALALWLLGAALSAGAQQAPALGRSVHGVVQDALSRPLAGAVVYLKNLRTKNIRSMITDASGRYSFHQLQANTNYQVHAEWRGHTSKTRTDSQYEFSQDLRLDLQIPVA